MSTRRTPYYSAYWLSWAYFAYWPYCRLNQSTRVLLVGQRPKMHVSVPLARQRRTPTQPR